MIFAREEKSAHMALWISLLVVALHLKTFYWLSHTAHEHQEKSLLPIEVTLITIPKPIPVEPEKPKPIAEPEKKPPPPKPKPKLIPKPEPKPEPVKPKPEPKPKLVEKAKPAPKAVLPNAPEEVEKPAAKTVPSIPAPAPVTVAPAQAVSSHQAPASSSSNGTGHAAKATAGNGDSDAYVPGSPIHTPHPSYPSMARSRHLEGKVVLLIKVNADGEVVNVSIEKSSGHDILDDAAQEGAEEWTFKPARRGGKPVAATYTRTIDFKLSE